ncbi:hypothetical protein [Frigoriflavimonas asaccharolytica]|uniref:C4-dicarboxylate-specific signal transduction histidine kinase n=1 Tax=Frigoriflavimonas asaccharolytica TaxID=2735899 RepID=A0A8J8GB37_9FLAO|nr:hypothetical protein [Frigoriflavimonas asaccharolytica]NRS92407.1 C4-dicarboxylate-specific signal transduction histidine kinase [Frigoriflavimonas asaccharolytica]
MEAIILSIISYLVLLIVFVICIVMFHKTKQSYKHRMQAQLQAQLERELKIAEILKDLKDYHLFLTEKAELLGEWEKEIRNLHQDLKKIKQMNIANNCQN